MDTDSLSRGGEGHRSVPHMGCTERPPSSPQYVYRCWQEGQATFTVSGNHGRHLGWQGEHGHLRRPFQELVSQVT